MRNVAATVVTLAVAVAAVRAFQTRRADAADLAFVGVSVVDVLGDRVVGGPDSDCPGQSHRTYRSESDYAPVPGFNRRGPTTEVFDSAVVG
jgi:hypothetical protein